MTVAMGPCMHLLAGHWHSDAVHASTLQKSYNVGEEDEEGSPVYLQTMGHLAQDDIAQESWPALVSQQQSKGYASLAGLPGSCC